MSFIFLLPVQAPLRWGFSRIGTRCADELNYKRGHVQSQVFLQQNQRKMPSKPFRRHFCLPYRSLAVNAFKTSGYAVGGVFVRIFSQHFKGCDGSFQD